MVLEMRMGRRVVVAVVGDKVARLLVGLQVCIQARVVNGGHTSMKASISQHVAYGLLPPRSTAGMMSTIELPRVFIETSLRRGASAVTGQPALVSLAA